MTETVSTRTRVPRTRARQRPGAPWLAVVALASMLGTLAVGSQRAAAIQVTDLRVGVHADYTRVVLETDAPVEPEMQRSDDMLVLRLAATSAPRAVAASRSPHVEAVNVAPVPGGSEVRIRLRGPAELEHFALRSPPRLVLDFSAAKGEAAPPVPEAEASRPEGEPEQETASTTAPSADAPQAATAPEASPSSAAAPEGAPAGDRPAAVSEAPPGPETAGDEPPSVREPGAAATADAPTRPARSQARELLEGGRAARPEAPEATEPRAAGDAPHMRPGASSGRGAGPERAVSPPPPEPKGPLGFLPAPLDQPITLALLGLLLLGLFVLSRMRRRERSARRDSLSPFDSELAVEEQQAGPASAQSDAEARGEPVGEGLEAEASDESELPAPAVRSTGSAVAGEQEHPPVFEPTDTGAGIEVPDDAREPASAAAEAEAGLETPAGLGATDAAARGAAAAPAAGAAESHAGPMGELERRLGYLERRLEEVVDEKERLERQVAAQTEELRVQRAAIARTQRVLRGMSRPDDEASEPVPR